MDRKLSVLFVDDEPRILQGLRRMLHTMRQQWDMAFVSGGRQALEVFSQKAVDVVVTDMRMPGMNGVELLSAVQERYPKTVRIVLSGHSDKDLILKAVSPTHQYLSKPCDAEQLIATITRSCNLNALLTKDCVRRIVARMDALPSLPSLYAQIMDEVQSADVSMQKIGHIVARDPAMSAKILQLVNSSFFGLPRRIADPQHAVNLLGLETIKALVLTTEIFSAFDSRNLSDAFIEGLWQHSLRTGDLAARIAKNESLDRMARDHSQMAGLLHDVGKLVLAARLPDDYAALSRRLAARPDQERIAVEQEIFGATHAEVGAYLLGLWGLPDPIVEAVLHHHSPTGRDFDALAAVCVADMLIKGSLSADDPAQVPADADADYLSGIHWPEKARAWQELYAQTAEEKI